MSIGSPPLRLAVFDWMSDGAGNIWTPTLGIQGYTTSLVLGVQHFNQRRGDILPVLGSLGSCTSQLSILRVCDEQGNVLLGSGQLLEQIRTNGVDAVLGYVNGFVSDSATQLAYNYGKLPMMGYWASAPELGDKTQYPTYARTGPNDADTAAYTAALIAQMGFDRVIIMYLVEDSGSQFQSILFTALESLNVLSASFSYTYYDAQSIDEAVAAISALDQNIVICVSYTDDVARVANSAVAHNMVRPDNFWLFPYLDRNFTTAEYADENISMLINGAFRLTNPLIRGGSNTLWNDYLEKWPTFNPGLINPLLPPFYGANSTTECLNYNLTYQLESDFFNQSLSYANEVFAWAHDAGVALGLASCQAPGARGMDLYQAILNTSFIGLSGNVTFDQNGNRDANSLPWIIFQFGGIDLVRQVGSWDPVTQMFLMDQTKLVFASGSSSFPVSITPPVENFNYLPSWARGLVYFELGLLNLVLLACGGWLVWNWHAKVVVNSQGPLLALLVLGLLIASWALLPLTVQDDQAGMDVSKACMATPAMFSIGFELALAALIGKMQRIRFLFYNPKIKKRTMKASHIILLVMLFMVLEVSFIVVWISVAPLTWERATVFQDVNGFIVESHGWCTGGSLTVTFTAIVFALYAVTLISSVFIARSIQNVPTDFQESRFVGYSLVSITQLYVVAVPTVVAVYSSPLGSFIIIAQLITFSVLSISFFMFFPKVYFLATGKELWPISSHDVLQTSPTSPLHFNNEGRVHSVRT